MLSVLFTIIWFWLSLNKEKFSNNIKKARHETLFNEGLAAKIACSYIKMKLK